MCVKARLADERLPTGMLTILAHIHMVMYLLLLCPSVVPPTAASAAVATLHLPQEACWYNFLPTSYALKPPEALNPKALNPPSCVGVAPKTVEACWV